MDITIDKIRMQLPAGFGSRAEEISRLVADYLSKKPFTGSVNIDQISIPAITVNHEHNNQSIAAKIADGVYEQIGGRQQVTVGERRGSYGNVNNKQKLPGAPLKGGKDD